MEHEADITRLIWSEKFMDHDTGDGHPEHPDRADAVGHALRESGLAKRNDVIEPAPVELEAVLSVHTPRLVERITDLAGGSGGWLDPDTYVSPDSVEVALLASGAACQAVDIAVAQDARAFALGRPPGHHAEPGRAMGFCLFNNIAVAAEHARQAHGLERIAILDWDVHHGNGTQAAFWADPGVLFVSLHQYPFYPGSGAATERGEGAGEGYTVNIPLPAGCDDSVYARAFEEIVIPSIRAYRPELLMVSAGFDAHEDDPLAMMRVSTAGFTAMAGAARALAGELCDGRLVLVLEGGYNLEALGESVVATIQELDQANNVNPKEGEQR